MKTVTIIGGGPGGYSAAIYCAKLGMQTTLIEKAHLGGTCLNEGCIPTKAFVHAAHLYRCVKEADAYGILPGENISVNFEKTAKYKNRTVSQLRNGIKFLLKKNNVSVINGIGRLVDQHTVAVETSEGIMELESDAIILATGSSDVVIPGFEPDDHLVVNSTGMLDMKVLPERTLIVGGGVIGVEFASILNNFGKEAIIVEMTSALLPSLDKEISYALRDAMEKKGVRILTSAKAERIVEKKAESVIVEIGLSDGSKEHIEVNKLLISVGRRANLEDIGLKKAGIEHTHRYIPTDSQMRTNVENIYAIGDLTASPMLAHVAYHEAMLAAFSIAGKEHPEATTAIPACIFSDPEVACVGLTEEEARQKYESVEVHKVDFAGNGKAMIEKENSGFAKLIVAGDEKQIVGFGIIGPKATELITEPALAVHLNLDAQSMASAIHAHPSLSEILGEAAADAFGLNIHE